jgi:hypothetical protein
VQAGDRLSAGEVRSGEGSLCEMQVPGETGLQIRLYADAAIELAQSEGLPEIVHRGGRVLIQSRDSAGGPDSYFVRIGELAVRPTGTAFVVAGSERKVSLKVLEGQIQVVRMADAAAPLGPGLFESGETREARAGEAVETDESTVEIRNLSPQERADGAAELKEWQPLDSQALTEPQRVRGASQRRDLAALAALVERAAGRNVPIPDFLQRVHLNDGRSIDGIAIREGDELRIITRDGEIRVRWGDVQDLEYLFDDPLPGDSGESPSSL